MNIAHIARPSRASSCCRHRPAAGRLGASALGGVAICRRRGGVGFDAGAARECAGRASARRTCMSRGAPARGYGASCACCASPSRGIALCPACHQASATRREMLMAARCRPRTSNEINGASALVGACRAE